MANETAPTQPRRIKILAKTQPQPKTTTKRQPKPEVPAEPKPAQNWIRVHVESTDGAKCTRCFRFIPAARSFAASYVGETPVVSDIGYAVSDDGVQKVTVAGTVTIWSLFPQQ